MDKLDQIVTEIRTVVARAFPGRSRSPKGQGGKVRILRHLQAHVGQAISGEELGIVSGIGEWARRVRELRVEDGYDIEEEIGPDPIRISFPATITGIFEIEIHDTGEQIAELRVDPK